MLRENFDSTDRPSAYSAQLVPDTGESHESSFLKPDVNACQTLDVASFSRTKVIIIYPYKLT